MRLYVHIIVWWKGKPTLTIITNYQKIYTGQAEADSFHLDLDDNAVLAFQKSLH